MHNNMFILESYATQAQTREFICEMSHFQK